MKKKTAMQLWEEIRYLHCVDSNEELAEFVEKKLQDCQRKKTGKKKAPRVVEI